MEVVALDISKIITNPNQPRKHFDEDRLRELADSIKSDGLKSPILVRPIGDQFEIVQGERRFRACKLAGLDTISSFIEELTEEDAFHLAVIENIQREQLTPIEEAQAFMWYVELGYTHEQISKKVSKSRTYVTSRLRLLKLIPIIQEWIASGKLTEGHAKQILKLESVFNRFLEKAAICYDSPFEYIQWRFHADFWSSIEKNEKVTVADVKGWADDWRFHLIRSVVAYTLGDVGFVVSYSSGYELNAENVCKVFGLNPSMLTDDDYMFANEYEREKYSDDYNEKFRPWMVDRYWDDAQRLIPTAKWKEPSDFKISDLNEREPQEKTLEEMEAKILSLKETADSALKILSERTGKSYEELFDEIIGDVSCDTL